MGIMPAKIAGIPQKTSGGIKSFTALFDPALSSTFQHFPAQEYRVCPALFERKTKNKKKSAVLDEFPQKTHARYYCFL
jgi:hypothetical protein